MAGPDVICVGAGKAAQEVLKVRGKLQFCVWFSASVGTFFFYLSVSVQRIEREATFSYQTLTVPEDIAANVLYVNGTLIHRSVDEIPESCKVRCSCDVFC
jgi:dimethylargininase